MQFQIKIIDTCYIKDELKSIGFAPEYIDCAVLKHKFLSLKIKNLPFYVSTIIKQTALSNGCDAGVHRDVLTAKQQISDLILSGTIKQLYSVAGSLKKQPFHLKVLAEKIEELLTEKQVKIPCIMGILNVTPDSFSDGGKFFDKDAAISHAYEMVKDGASIIDIGAESTRPNAKPVDYMTEIKRLEPVVKEVLKAGVKVSIDTRNAKTAEYMINLGAHIINDVSGLNYDPLMLDVIKNSDAKVVLTHSRGTPETMDTLTQYENMQDEVFQFLQNKINLLLENNVSKERIFADAGFGFAKNVGQNFELLKRIKEFNSLGVKTLAGVSRKRFLKSILKEETLKTEELDKLTAITSFYFAQNKIDVIRVHNVRSTHLALELYKKITSDGS